MNRTVTYLATALLSGLMFASHAVAVPYSNATLDFSIASNPNGVWTYGYLDVSGATFTPYSTSTSDWHSPASTPDNALQGWSQFTYDSGSYSVVGKNVTNGLAMENPAGSIEVDPNTLFTHPGDSGEKGTFRYTAPVAGNFTYRVKFSPTDTLGGNRDVHVYVNGVDEFLVPTFVIGNKSTGNSVSAFATVPLLAGETIDFAVGYGLGGYGNDATALQITVPEPSTVALVSLGAAGLFFVRRRRHA